MHIPSLVAILPFLSRRQTIPNYESYPSCVTPCQEQAFASSGCDFTTEIAYVACLCSNGAGQAVFARCVYTDCGGQVLNETAAIHVYNCQINGSPSALSQSQLIADGEPAGSEPPPSAASTVAGLETSSISTLTGVQQISTSIRMGTTLLTSTFIVASSPTSTSATQNSDATPTKASSSTLSSTSDGSGGLSTASLVGTIIASVTGAIGSCVGAWFTWKKYKDSKKEKEKEKNSSSSDGS